MKQYKFTVFTPCYNGEHFIGRVFKSLRESTFRNFEWIIVNDGSSDDSDRVIRELIATVDWDITYVNWTKNQGKHFAWNYALKIAKGDIWMPIDCDDNFVPEAMSFFNEKWNELESDRNVYGIQVLCFDSVTNEVIGTTFPTDGLRANFLDLKYKYGICGEKWDVIRMEYAKQYPFPPVSAHYYLGTYLWNSLGKKYVTVCYNKKFRRYFVEPTSICNTSITSRNNIYMSLHHNRWFLKNYTGYMLKNDPKGLLAIYKQMVRMFIKYRLMKFLHAKEIVNG